MTKDTRVVLNVRAVNLYLMIGLLLILIFSAYTVLQVQKQFKEVKPPEPPKLAKLMITIITPPQCDDCFDSSLFVAAVKQVPLTNVTSQNVVFDSIEGQKLIAKHQFKRLPAAVVTGEIENVTIQGFTKADGAYIFTETPPPYYDISKAGVIGRVSVTFITDAGCPKCFDISQFADQLEQLGVSMSSKKTLDFADHDAKALIEKYKITTVPTMLLSQDALAYDMLKQAWPQVGSQESDGMLVLRNATPPYKDLTTKQVRGFVTITYLTDPSCTVCYNVSLHKLVLQQSFGMQFKDERTVEISSPAGQRLIEKYKITAVPTLLLDKEAEAYPSLIQTWAQVGSHEPDGTFVFKRVELLQGVTYKDLSTNTIKNATATP